MVITTYRLLSCAAFTRIDVHVWEDGRPTLARTILVPATEYRRS